jgi:hypothetical protein
VLTVSGWVIQEPAQRRTEGSAGTATALPGPVPRSRRQALICSLHTMIVVSPLACDIVWQRYDDSVL